MSRSRAEPAGARRVGAIARALVLSSALAVLAGAVDARQFRSRRVIATPDAASAHLPAGATAVTTLVPLTRAQAQAALARVLAAWNDGDIARHLGDGFYDRDRLADNIEALVRRDARLVLQAVQGVQTLSQYIEPDPLRPGRARLVSRVSVTARTQVEYEAATGRFVRRSGINEFLLRIVHQESAR